jgi:hypothetical protein
MRTSAIEANFRRHRIQPGTVPQRLSDFFLCARSIPATIKDLAFFGDSIRSESLRKMGITSPKIEICAISWDERWILVNAKPAGELIPRLSLEAIDFTTKVDKKPVNTHGEFQKELNRLRAEKRGQAKRSAPSDSPPATPKLAT